MPLISTGSTAYTPRVCRICGVEKIKELDFSPNGIITHRKDCKKCVNEKRKAEYELQIGRREDGQCIAQKECIICNKIKDVNLNNFTRAGGVFTKVCRECKEKSKKVVSEIGENKKCYKCLEDKDLSKFSFHKNLGRYSNVCKQCHVEECKKSNKKHYKKRSEYSSRYKSQNRAKTIIKEYNNRDFLKGQTFDLTLDFVELELQKSCTYCGFPSTGLDRKDNNIGHTMENCVPACKECNVARMNNFSFEEMFLLGQTIKLIKQNRQNG